MAEKQGVWVYSGLILLQSVVYGIGNPLTKVAYQSISPFWLLSCRFSLAFVLFMALFGKRVLAQLRTIKPGQILPASLCMALAYILCNVALSMTSATKVGFMMTLAVVIAPLLSVVALKKKYQLRHLPVQLLVLVGVFLLCGLGGTVAVNKGDLVSLAMAFFLAGALVYGEKSLKNLDAVAVSAAQCGMTAIISLACALVFDDLNKIAAVQPAAWMITVYLAVFCTCLAYFFQNLALARLKAPTVSMLQCTQPILTAIVAFLMLGEAMGPGALAGAGIIMLCIVAENLLQRKEQILPPGGEAAPAPVANTASVNDPISAPESV